MLCRSLWLLLFAWLVGCSRLPPTQVPAGPSAAFDRVVVISIDGLRAADAMRLPQLAELAREGAVAAPPDGALSVTLAVTAPAHVSIATGVVPAKHGIVTNHPNTQSGRQGKRRRDWSARDVRVPTLYDAAWDANLRAALLHWPAARGARAHVIAIGQKMLRSGPGARGSAAEAEADDDDGDAETAPKSRQHPKHSAMSDARIANEALEVLEHDAPNLLLVHFMGPDKQGHLTGPDSASSQGAREEAERQVMRLLDALERSPDWERTAVVIVSDHGFAPYSKQLAPVPLLVEAGLWDRVRLSIEGGGGMYAYVNDPADEAAAAGLRQLFTQLAADPNSGVRSVIEHDEIVLRGGDPAALLAVEASPGFRITGIEGLPIVGACEPRGTHGQFPERPEMRATLIVYGPRVLPQKLVGARLIDVAPTIAGWLGLKLGEVDGKPLPIRLR